MERIEGEGGSHTERENLPDEVEPRVTYRDVRVRWRAAAKLKAPTVAKRPRLSFYHTSLSLIRSTIRAW